MATMYQHFIDGQWTSGETGEMMDVVNPCNREVVARVPCGTTADLDRAVASARAAFESGIWAGQSKEERSQILMDASFHIEKHRGALADLEARTSGMTIRFASGVDIGGVVNSLKFCARALTEMPLVEHLACMPWYVSHRSTIVREPIGVCAAITHWHFPLMMAGWKIAPALAMGNSIVMKPSSNTPATALELARLLHEAGIPAGVFNVVTGPDPLVNDLAAHPDVGMVSFSGPAAAGRDIARLAIGGIKRLSLDLGGNSAVIVLDDADLNLASSMATWAFLMQNGQTSASGTRLLAPRNLQAQIVELMAAKIKRMVIGDQMDRRTDLGPIVSEEQLRIIMDYVEIGKQEGAELAYGGRRLSGGIYDRGFFHEPTIFINCHNQMRQAREEIFGPVQCVIPYDDEEEAIAIANDSPYGLAGGVCSANATRAHWVAKKLRAGTIWINTYHSLRPDAPFGGYKGSGYGRENGYQALMDYSEIKHVCHSLAPDPKGNMLFKWIGL